MVQSLTALIENLENILVRNNFLHMSYGDDKTSTLILYLYTYTSIIHILTRVSILFLRHKEFYYFVGDKIVLLDIPFLNKSILLTHQKKS